MSKTQLQTNNTRLASLIDRLDEKITNAGTSLCKVTLQTDDIGSVANQYMPIWYIDESFSLKKFNAGGKDENGNTKNEWVWEFYTIRGSIIHTDNFFIDGGIEGDAQSITATGSAIYVYGDCLIDYC